jgi:hypothetical protein
LFGVHPPTYPERVDLASAILTGLGLAAAAGLNAYIPLVIVGFLQYFDWVDFGQPFDNLANPWVLGVLVVLLAVEVLADKIPAVDSVNDIIQTVVRPAAGAVLFAASTSLGTDIPPVVSLIAGLITAGAVHGTKAAIRPVLNAGSAGVAAPVVSTTEDIASTALAFVAILAPFLVLFAIAGFVWLVVRWRRRRRLAAQSQPA